MAAAPSAFSNHRRSEGASSSDSWRRGPLRIILPDLHPDAVQAILDYHYVGKVTIRGLEALLALAFAVQELGVSHMKEFISKKIVECVNAETCVAIMQRSPQEWREPFHVAWRFALAQFDQVARSSSFLKLDKSRLEELLRYILSPCCMHELAGVGWCIQGLPHLSAGKEVLCTHG